MIKPRLLFILFLFPLFLHGQTPRLRDYNSIGWTAINASIKLDSNWSVWCEYQSRRTGFYENRQQELFRTGITFRVNSGVLVRAGYAYVGTYAYGDYPLIASGKFFPEHRTYQALILNSSFGRLECMQRLMIEQRWIGKYASSASNDIDHYAPVGRLRYQLRFQFPLSKKDTHWYVATFDELFIGYGGNVGENIFDQNRFAFLLGHKFSKSFRLEGGYFNQTLQLGREVEGKNVFQYNNGVLVTAALNL